MKPQRLSIKFFTEQPDVDPTGFVPVFHRWIREDATGDLLIDVVDYKHVHEGPGIMLVGHEADYGIDMGRGRPGLLVTLKRLSTDKLVDALELLLTKALHAGRLLQIEPSINPPLSLLGGEFVVTFLDRLRYPNTEQTRALIRKDLDHAVRLYAGGQVEWTSRRESDDVRLPLAECVRVPSIETLPVDTGVVPSQQREAHESRT